MDSKDYDEGEEAGDCLVERCERCGKIDCECDGDQWTSLGEE